MKKNKKISFLGKAAIGLIVFFVPAVVAWRNIFPVFHYDIKAEQTEAAKGAFWRDDYLVINNPLAKDNFLDEIKIKILFKKEGRINRINCCQCEVWQSYEAEVYPRGEQIADEERLREYLFYENHTEIPNGTLFSNKGSVFLVSRGKRRPVINATIFNQKGFPWEAVKAFDDQTTARFPLGEKIRAGSPHPDGVILENNQGEKRLVWEKKLLPVKEEILKKEWPQVWSVKSVAKKFNQCYVIQQNPQGEDCVFLASSQEDSSGDAFLITLAPDREKASIKRLEVTISSSLKLGRQQTQAAWNAFKRRLKEKIIHKFWKDETNR
jgi:hypothetical protein